MDIRENAMKIIIISPFYFPSMGGVEAIVKQTADELARRKNKVAVITTNYSNSWVKLSEPNVSEENGVTVHRLKPRIKLGFASFMDHLTDVILKEKPDIVHCHNLHPHLFQAINVKSDCQFKLVAQMHYPAATGIDGLGAKLAYPIVTSLLRRRQLKVDAFIVHTNLEKNWLIDEGFAESKIHKLNYPCVSSRLLKDVNSIKRKDSVFPKKPDLLYIGRIARRKGLHIFLQALPSIINNFKDLTVVVAGPTDQKYYKELLSLAAKLTLGENVFFSQALSEEAKYSVMNECKIFVVPSIKDYTPVTLIEAQALGKPVISTLTGAIPEIVQDNLTGLLVEPENPLALAKAIERLLSSKEERDFMGKSSLQWIQQNFLLDEVIDKLYTIYENA